MGDLQDPTDGGRVQYVWPYFEGIFPEIEPLHMPYIWQVPPIQVSEMAIESMTGNGKHTTYDNGDDWGMVKIC